MNPQDQDTTPKPVAYDAEGRPLYHHPPATNTPPASPQPATQFEPPSQLPPVPVPTVPHITQPNVYAPGAAPSTSGPSPAPEPQSSEHHSTTSFEGDIQQASMKDTPDSGPASSHVSSRPEVIEGHNFNPRLRSQYANEPKVVHASRPVETKSYVISEKVRKKHKASQEKYPYLNLSEGEFVILDIKRHPIGVMLPIGVAMALILAILMFASFYPSMYEDSISSIMPTPVAMFGILVLLAVGVVLGAAVVLWVYLQNQFFMTNESVIQEIQESLFSRREQTVSLGSIEDASYFQTGILQTILNYGRIRLSTEGEETTYTFRYVENPRKQIAILNNAIEAFKNGRPVDDPHDN